MKPKELRLLVVAWFAKNHDEELTAQDIAMKFDLQGWKRVEVSRFLMALVRDQFLEVCRDGRENQYRAGPRIR